MRGNRWYDHATGKGGYAIDFVRTFYNQSFPDTVTMLLGGEQGQIYRESKACEPEPVKPFALPQAHIRKEKHSKEMKKAVIQDIVFTGLATAI